MSNPNTRLGRYVTISTASEKAQAYLPPPLPPDPPVKMENLYGLLERANLELGRLESLARQVPHIGLFLYNYVRKESLLSSQIEGTQSSFSELLLHESAQAPGVPTDKDVEEVVRYVKAMDLGIERLREGIPISVRLLREMHEVLLSHGRGSSQLPGEFRRSQNWIGGTRPGNARFVPPPHEQVVELMSDLEKFIHADTPFIPQLVKVGLVHVQLETIHPFLDGNGRLGRLLITLLLHAYDVLTMPLLYLSLYMKTHRDEYYDLLQGVRTRGDWERWTGFFLEGIVSTAREATSTIGETLRLFDEDARKIESLGRPADSARRVHELLKQTPLVTVPNAAKRIDISAQTIAKSMAHLERLGIVREISGRQRRRLFSYEGYLSILARDTEPLSR